MKILSLIELLCKAMLDAESEPEVSDNFNFQNITSFMLILPVWLGRCWVYAPVTSGTWGQASLAGCRQF